MIKKKNMWEEKGHMPGVSEIAAGPKYPRPMCMPRAHEFLRTQVKKCSKALGNLVSLGSESQNQIKAPQLLG